MNNIIRGEDDYEHGREDEGEEEEDKCREEEETQVVHDVDTGDHNKLPKGNRGRTWRPKEDAALCVAWMGVSQDSIIGAQQNSNSYWIRIHKDFLERTAHPPLNVLPCRKANAIEKRWGPYERSSTSSMDVTIR